jgi:hypothetical protein
VKLNHSLPFSAEVKNGGAIPPLFHTSSWRGVSLNKDRERFTYLWVERMDI